MALRRHLRIKPFRNPRLDYGLTINSKPHGLRIESSDHPLRKVNINAFYLPIWIHRIIKVEELSHVLSGIKCRFQLIVRFYPAHSVSPLLQLPCVPK